jgi:hypothetical protein
MLDELHAKHQNYTHLLGTLHALCAPKKTYGCEHNLDVLLQRA